MAPSRIMFIRHAEKPENGAGAVGVTPKGEESHEALVVRGWMRAGALVRFFCPRPGDSDHGVSTPHTVFACKFADGHSGSERPIETVKPLVHLLEAAVQFVTDHFPDAHRDVADDIMTRHGVVLVAWEHHAIRKIIAHIPGAPAVPEWPDPRFDLVWILDHGAGGWSFHQVPQLLLAGDSKDLVPHS